VLKSVTHVELAGAPGGSFAAARLDWCCRTVGGSWVNSRGWLADASGFLIGAAARLVDVGSTRGAASLTRRASWLVLPLMGKAGRRHRFFVVDYLTYVHVFCITYLHIVQQYSSARAVEWLMLRGWWHELSNAIGLMLLGA
jgi:hypothetical protein